MILPDIYEAEEKMLFATAGFEDYFEHRGTGWLDPCESLVRIVERSTVEETPNASKERIRQMVVNVMVFTLPDELYVKARQKHPQNEFYLLREIIDHAKFITGIRLNASNESRLHGKLAAGLGGHVNIDDFQQLPTKNKFDCLLRNAAIREMCEEIKPVNSNGTLTYNTILNTGLVPLGVINSGADEVERIHMGFSYVIAFPESVGLELIEKEKMEEVHIPLNEFNLHLQMEHNEGTFELDNWTRISFAIPKNLYAGLISRSIALSRKATDYVSQSNT